MIHGTFTYHPQSGKITLQTASGERLGALNLNLPGDSQSSIGDAPQYRSVQLWLGEDPHGETPQIATADRACPPFSWAETFARILCAPAWLPRQIRLLPAQRPQQQSEQQTAAHRYHQPDYQFPPRRTLVEALGTRWRQRRTDILIGWGYIAVFILTVLWLKNAVWLGLILLYPLWVCIGAALAAIFLKYRSSRQQKVIIRHWHNGQFQKALKVHIEKPEKP